MSNIITYQGFNCSSVVFRTSVGILHDASQVEIFIPDYPGLLFTDDEGDDAPPAIAEKFQQPNVVKKFGPLFMSATEDGRLFSRTVDRLYVVGVRKPRANRDEGLVRLTLVDGRFFWNRGFLEEWRFNMPGAFPVRLDDMVGFIVSDLPNTIGVRRTPESWATKFPRYEFDYLGRPRKALRKILEDHDTFMSWNDDSSVSFWEEGERSLELDQLTAGRAKSIEDSFGEGHVIGRGFRHPAPVIGVVGGKRIATVGIDNWVPVVMIDSVPVPLSEALERFAPEGAAEAAAQRRIDASEERGRITRLRSEQADLGPIGPDVVTAARQELQAAQEALSEFSTLPAAPDDDPFRAERFLRGTERFLPGPGDILRPGGRQLAELIQDVKDKQAALNQILEDQFQSDAIDERIKAAEVRLAAEERSRAASSDLAWLRRFVLRPDAWQVRAEFEEDELDILRRDAYRLYQLPGATTFNKHLLPLLSRAETNSAGGRLPIQVRTFRWKKIPTKLLRGLALNAAKRAFERALKDINAASGGIFAGFDDFLFGPGGVVDLGLEFFGAPGATPRGVLGPGIGTPQDEVDARIALANLATFERSIAAEALSQVILINKIKRDAPELLAGYIRARDALVTELKREDPLFDGDLLNKLSRDLVSAGKDFRESNNDPNALGSIKALIDEIRKLREQKAESLLVGASSKKLPEPYVFANYPVPVLDPTARVVDAKLGIVRVSFPAGKLTNLAVHTLDAAGGLLAGEGPDQSWPVKVFFGTHMAPRRVTVTGRRGEGDELPFQVQEIIREGKESLGYYTIGFSRVLNGAAVPLEGVRASDVETIHSNKLVELITIRGKTNKEELDAKALKLAEPLLARSVIDSSERILYLRPLKIDCDGTLSAIEVTSRRGMKGFNTYLVTGKTNKPYTDVNKRNDRDDLGDDMTRPRPRAEDP